MKQNIVNILGAASSATLAVLTLQGKTGIAFADPLNEMVFFLLACGMSIAFLGSLKVKKSKKAKVVRYGDERLIVRNGKIVGHK